MTDTKRIIITEDEKALGSFLKTMLAGVGYTAILARSGKEALSLTLSHNPDLILLNLGLPDIDGMTVLNDVREWSDVPIIILSARDSERSVVDALDAGANDYIRKPFGNAELLARIRAALRDNEKRPAESWHSVFSNGTINIDYATREIAVSGRPVHLTPIEYKITVLLARHVNKVLTHEYILGKIWGPSGGDSQTLRVNIANIRRKLEADSSEPVHILTATGVGYIMPDLSAREPINAASRR